MPKGKFKETGSSAMPPNKQGVVAKKQKPKRADGTFKMRVKKGLGNGPKSGKKKYS